MTSKVFDGLQFDKILVKKGIAVVIKQGDVCKVEVSAGQNLINDIEVTVDGNMLSLADNTTCNWTREYGATTVYVTAPNLTDIYCKGEQTITSEGILTYPNLQLSAMDSYDGYAGVGNGDFRIQVQNESLTINSNQISRFYITGTTAALHVNFYESGGIFHGENLLSDAVYVYHRGTDDIYIHPINSLTGDIYNVGNIFSVTHPILPPTVTQHYQGRLIFY